MGKEGTLCFRFFGSSLDSVSCARVRDVITYGDIHLYLKIYELRTHHKFATKIHSRPTYIFNDLSWIHIV